MPYQKILDRHWTRDRVTIELHGHGIERAYAMGVKAAIDTMRRRMKRLLRQRIRALSERDPIIALDGKCQNVLTMPKQIKALEHGAHVALLCGLDDIERGFGNEWWDDKDEEDERTEKA